MDIGGTINRILNWLDMSKIITVILLVCLLAGCGWFARKPAGTPGVADTTPLPVMPQAQKAISSLPWVVLLCVLGLGVSVALLVQGNKLGIAGIAGCGTSLIAAVVVSQWLWLIAWVGGAIALAVAGVLIWRIWIHRKALSEVVWTAEEAKRLLPEAAISMLFGDANDNGKAGEIQSPATEKIVAKIRANGE